MLQVSNCQLSQYLGGLTIQMYDIFIIVANSVAYRLVLYAILRWLLVDILLIPIVRDLNGA